MLQNFLAGAISMGFALASLFFFRFWVRIREDLFLAFSGCFILLAINQTLLSLSDVAFEERSWLYVIRLAAFLLIILAIWQHNRKVGPRK